MRKKVFGSLLLFLCAVLVTTGCDTKTNNNLTNKNDNKNNNQDVVNKEVVTKCTLSKSDSTNGYDVNSTYTVYSTDKIVNKVETVEKVTSTNASVLKQFEDTLNNLYSSMNSKYGGYTFSVTNSNNEVVATTKIDYTKLDIAKLVSDEPSTKSIVNSDNKITLDGILKTYEQIGAVCQK